MSPLLLILILYEVSNICELEVDLHCTANSQKRGPLVYSKIYSNK